jgi:hypothetical protein
MLVMVAMLYLLSPLFQAALISILIRLPFA